MADYYDSYKNMKNDSEDGLFPPSYDEREKVISEFIRLLGYYLDSGKNEITYTSNERAEIEKVLDIINQLIKDGHFSLAEYYIVSMQLALGLEVRLRDRLKAMMDENVDVNMFFRIDSYKGKEQEAVIFEKIELLQEKRRRLSEARKMLEEDEKNKGGKGK